MEETICRCDDCGRIIKKSQVVEFPDARWAVLYCDFKGGKYHCPTLDLEDITLCVDCVVPYFRKWVDAIKSDPDYIC